VIGLERVRPPRPSVPPRAWSCLASLAVVCLAVAACASPTVSPASSARPSTAPVASTATPSPAVTPTLEPPTPAPPTPSPPALATPSPLPSEPTSAPAAPAGEIAYVRGETGVLYLRNLADGTDKRLATGEAPAWAPDGVRLAFVRPTSGGLPDLWLLDVESGKERRLVNEAVGAVWSPTGDTLAVNRSPIDLGDTWRVNPDGTGLRQLATGDDAAWSPDGRSLVIVTGSAVPMVALVGLATGHLTPLAEGTSPTWTGEARPRIAYIEWGTGQVALVDPLTRVVERLTALEAPAAHLVRVPAPTPPGWALAFVSGGRPWVLDSIQGVARSLSVGAVVDGPISASPDGTWYAVVGSNADGSDLYIVRADGEGWLPLTNEGDVTTVAWRPSR